LRKSIKSIKNDARGSVFVELIVKFLIFTVVLLLAINIFDLVLKYQNVSYASKTIAKTVELEGALTVAAYSQMEALNDNFGMDMSFDISNVTYFNPAARLIQFREPFTITVNYNYAFTVITPVFTSTPIVINVPMVATVNGMSEVYWKP
jgi:Flp pilus assembly protein TadG